MIRPNEDIYFPSMCKTDLVQKKPKNKNKNKNKTKQKTSTEMVLCYLSKVPG